MLLELLLLALSVSIIVSQSVVRGLNSSTVKGLPREKIDKNTFPLPNALSQKLNALTKDVHIGLGVAVIRGLHRAKFNHEEWVIAFAGVTSHICPLRASDSFANQALSHIRDATYDKVPAGAENIGLAGSKIPVKMVCWATS